MLEATRGHSRNTVLVIIPSLIAYTFIGYCIPRESFLTLLFCFTVAFAGYLILYNRAGKNFSVRRGYQMAMGFRLLFLFAIPELSDDFYRFIWDGRISLGGLNPFVYVPADILENASGTIEGIDANLFSNLNSPSYYSVYPPFCQLVFYISSFLSGGSLFFNIVWLRIFLLGAEGVTLYFLPKLLLKYNLPEKAGLLYALNPLVIIELSGNLHFEAVMICFVTLFLFYWKDKKLIRSASYFGLAVITKLIPVIFLPLLFAKLGWKKFLLFTSIIAIITLAAFSPFVAGFNGFSESLTLYFQKFEYNASIYFLIREVGLYIAGFNLIYWVGKGLALLTLLIILWYAWIKRQSEHSLPYFFLWVLFIFLLFATTVHPWYIIPLIYLAVFTNYRFPILWSFLIFFTYIQYIQFSFQENLLVVFMEYLLLFLYIWYESSYSKLKYI